jgi:hypothetical protein
MNGRAIYRIASVLAEAASAMATDTRNQILSESR